MELAVFSKRFNGLSLQFTDIHIQCSRVFQGGVLEVLPKLYNQACKAVIATAFKGILKPMLSAKDRKQFHVLMKTVAECSIAKKRCTGISEIITQNPRPDFR